MVRKETEIDPASDEAREYELPRAWQYDDYREVDGVMLPFWVYVEERIFAREYIFETIEVNVAIDDALFEPPEGAATGSPGTE